MGKGLAVYSMCIESVQPGHVDQHCHRLRCTCIGRPKLQSSGQVRSNQGIRSGMARRVSGTSQQVRRTASI